MGRLPALKRLARLDFIVRVFRTSQHDSAAPAERRSRYVPATTVADMDEHRVASRGIQALDDAIPTLITASRTERDDEAVMRPVRRGLHLHAVNRSPKSAIRS